jgi:glutathione-specific gamma-glutamylcyclotransferase
MPATERQPDNPLWVFGYGSLMWRPGFVYESASRARLAGLHRALCIYSVHYRGTHHRPGLVFGLQSGGACEGLVFQVAAQHAATTIAYLNQREMITGVYRSRLHSVTLTDGSHRTVQALCYVADRTHPQAARGLTLSDQAQLVSGSRGSAGRNIDYVLSTLQHLHSLAIHDPMLERLVTVMGGHHRLRGAPITDQHRLLPPRAYPARLAQHLPPDRMLRNNHRRSLGL